MFFTSSHRFGGCSEGCFQILCWLLGSDLGSQSWTSNLSFIWIFSCIPVVADCCLWLRLSIGSSYTKGQQFSWSFSRQHLRCNNLLFVSNFVRGWLLTCLFRVTVAPCAPFRGGAQILYRNGIQLCQLFPGAPIILYLSRYRRNLWSNSCTQIFLYPDVCSSISFYSVLFLYCS